MLKIKNAFITTPIGDIIDELQHQLKANNIELLNKVVHGRTNSQMTCPFHSNGQERNPSSGISTVDRNIGGKLIQAGTFHCLNCHETMFIDELISKCFGYEDFGRFGRKWIIKNFVSVNIEQRDGLKKMPERRTKDKSVEQNYITEEELDEYRYLHPYMYERRLTDEIIEKFDIGYDPEFRMTENSEPFEAITFPVWNERGICVFVARRAIKSKVFHYPPGSDKPVYALNYITSDMPKVYVTESIINALTLWSYGKPAIALIGTGSFPQYEILKKSKIRHFVLALDPDEAGQRGTARFRKYVNNKFISEVVYKEIGKDAPDINDLSEQEFNKLAVVL